MDADEPSINAVQSDVVLTAGQHPQASIGKRDGRAGPFFECFTAIAQAELDRIWNAQQWAPTSGEVDRQPSSIAVRSAEVNVFHAEAPTRRCPSVARTRVSARVVTWSAVSCPIPMKRSMPGWRPAQMRLTLAGTKVLTTKPFKNLDEDELNGQAVIEPENDFLVFGKISERLIKRFEAFASAFEAVTAGF